MVHKFHWYTMLMAVVLSIGLMVSLGHLAHAQASQVKCTLHAEQPFKSGENIHTKGGINCSDPAKQEWITVQLQKYTDGKWVTVETVNKIFDPGDNWTEFDTPCDTKGETLYRNYVTGQYRIDSQWQAIPKHEESQNVITCS